MLYPKAGPSGLPTVDYCHCNQVHPSCCWHPLLFPIKRTNKPLSCLFSLCKFIPSSLSCSLQYFQLWHSGQYRQHILCACSVYFTLKSTIKLSIPFLLHQQLDINLNNTILKSSSQSLIDII